MGAQKRVLNKSTTEQVMCLTFLFLNYYEEISIFIAEPDNTKADAIIENIRGEIVAAQVKAKTKETSFKDPKIGWEKIDEALDEMLKDINDGDEKYRKALTRTLKINIHRRSAFCGRLSI